MLQFKVLYTIFRLRNTIRKMFKINDYTLPAYVVKKCILCYKVRLNHGTYRYRSIYSYLTAFRFLDIAVFYLCGNNKIRKPNKP